MRLGACLGSAMLLASACSDSDAPRHEDDAGRDEDAGAVPMDAGSGLDAAMDATAPMDAGDTDAAEDAAVAPMLGLDARPENTTCLAPKLGEDMPAKLSETGCFDAQDPKIPLPALIPFDLNAALWSDSASKHRWMALPEGGTIALDDDGDFLFPPGTMLIKEFRLEGRLLETRFMVHHPASDEPLDDAGTPSEPQWIGYTYQWNEAQTDAELVPDGPTTPFDIDGAGPSDETWQVPNRTECMTCHTKVANFSLGPEIGQLNRDLTYPATGRTANQLLTLESIGVLAEPLAGPLNTLLRFEPYENNPEASVNDMARSYLHVNCSMCHRKPGENFGAAGSAPDDFRATIPFDQMGICDVNPTGGAAAGLMMDLDTAKILAPNDPENSLFWRRMSSRPNFQMPPIGSKKVDELGKNLLESWIKTIPSCDVGP